MSVRVHVYKCMFEYVFMYVYMYVCANKHTHTCTAVV